MTLGSPGGAQARVVGQRIIWHDLAGRPVEFVVTQENLGEPDKVVLLFENQDAIELRVAWRIPVIGFLPSPAWYLFVDTTTNELLSTVQLFLT